MTGTIKEFPPNFIAQDLKTLAQDNKEMANVEELFCNLKSDTDQAASQHKDRLVKLFAGVQLKSWSSDSRSIFPRIRMACPLSFGRPTPRPKRSLRLPKATWTRSIVLCDAVVICVVTCGIQVDMGKGRLVASNCSVAMPLCSLGQPRCPQQSSIRLDRHLGLSNHSNSAGPQAPRRAILRESNQGDSGAYSALIPANRSIFEGQCHDTNATDKRLYQIQAGFVDHGGRTPLTHFSPLHPGQAQRG